MRSVTVTLPDGSQKRLPAGVSPWSIAMEIGKRLGEASVAAKVNGKIVDVTSRIDADCALAMITRQSHEGLQVLRHSTAHLLAMAVKELFPKTQITIGPVTAEGFYYDFDSSHQFTPEDLVTIESRMKEISQRHLEVTRQEWPRDEAVIFFKNAKEHFKAEIIQSLPDQTVSTYRQGDFIDLCRGPHVPNTSCLGHFKLLSIAGAYWRGDEKNKMLQRIYGTAFASKEELDQYLLQVEEAKKRDHRKLGPELGLFSFLTVAPAMPFFLPRGALLYHSLLDFMRCQMLSQGYQEVICPQLMTVDLWKSSGHLDHFKQNLYFVNQGEDPQSPTQLCLKPMNCPGHALLFAATKRSYRELPIRFAEFTKLHRNERAGVTHGILRVRNFSQDDAHIFCTEDQIGQEALTVLHQTYDIYRIFGFKDVTVKLATRPESSLGSSESWDRATLALEQSLKAAGKAFEFQPGEGAFYGPKIEFHIKDSIGRFWQCGTIQLDFTLPERFKLEYVDASSGNRRPVMIHRAILGSLERFMGVLIEHHAGHLPVWLAPVQVLLLNVTEAQEKYVKELEAMLKSWNVRVETDIRNEKLGYKIREAQLRRVPLMLVLGDREMENKKISLRKSSGETLNDLSFDSFRQFLEPQLKPGG